MNRQLTSGAAVAGAALPDTIKAPVATAKRLLDVGKS
jgi:hypothetical protein